MHLRLFLLLVVATYGRYVSWIVTREAPVEQINEKTGYDRCYDRCVHPIAMVILFVYTLEKTDISVREGQSGASYLT